MPSSQAPAATGTAARTARLGSGSGLPVVTELLDLAVADLGGARRPGQVTMAEAVSESLEIGTHLAVQAGTGTGKSLAYLVPAVLSGKKVVVATATKALQDQLAEKDLPQVERGLGLPFTFAVLKGRSNYICRQRVDEVGNGGIQQELGDGAVDELRDREPAVSDDSGQEAAD